MNWVRFSYLNGVSSIERAYRESVRAFEDDAAKSEQRWQRMRSEPDFDADDGETRHHAEHLGDIALQSQQSIKAVREAFAVILYHHWEVQACFHLNLEEYKYKEVYKKAAEKSPYFSIDQDGIERLRLIVNTIKHGAGVLIKTAPELYDTSLIPQNPPNETEVGPESFHYRNAFRLPAAELDAAFTAVRASGPSGVYPDDEEEEVDLSKVEPKRQ